MHKTLLRQLRRMLGAADDAAVARLLEMFAAAAEGAPPAPELLAALPHVPELLERIGNSYEHYDRELELRSRSLEISSAELTASNDRLREQLAARERVIRVLRDTAHTLQHEAGFAGSQENNDDLDSLIELVSGLVAYREESQRELQRTHRALENQKFALDQHAIVSITDIAGTIIYANDRFCAISGYTQEELLGRNHRLVNSGQHPDEFFKGMWTTITAGKVWHGEISNRAKDGRIYWVAATVVPFLDDDGRPYQFAGIRTDITQRKAFEQETLRAKEVAEAANRAKSEFLANMSHEIRTPMNGIIGMTELALDTTLSDEQREYLNIVKTSAESLLTIINDILDFSKIEAGKLAMEATAFDLGETIGETLKTLALRAHQKGLELLCQIDPQLPTWVVGDSGRLRQIVINLVGNAIKFTSRGEIVVSAKPVADMLNMIEFSVADTGIGIPPEKQHLIFDAFAQEDSTTTRKYGGTGLGLTISARLAEMMGGSIWVDSTPGIGSTFYFTGRFPQADAAPVAAERPEVKLAGLRTLIVDDNAVNRRILQDTLSAWGIDAVAAAGGQEALEVLGADAAGFDLILLDAMMPVMDGFETAHMLRRLPLAKNPAIVMLSSAGYGDDAERWRHAGIDRYLTKPVMQSELRQAIVKALGVAPDPAGESGQDGRPAQPALFVLLVEDHPVNQKLALAMLDKWGYRTMLATNGEEALHLLAAHRFDLVLMDVQMPVLDGLAATRRFRAGESGKRTPIVAMTANAMEGDRERCLDAGMDDYLAKPINRNQLAAAIARHVPAAAAPGAAAVPAAPFDFAAGLADVDREIVAIVAPTFHAEFPKDIERLRQAAADRDEATLRRTAHSIKSACALFGAQPMVDVARSIETLPPVFEWTSVPLAIDRLAAAYPALAEALRNLGD